MRRPRLAPGFTAMVDGAGESLWLVAGEDVRYRLRLADPAWLRDLLARCDGTHTVDELSKAHTDARATIERLLEERVLVEGTAAQAHAPSRPAYRVIGTGALADGIRHARSDNAHPPQPDIASPSEPARASSSEIAQASSSDIARASPSDVARASSDIAVFVQDRLDHKALLAMNRKMLDEKARWVWVTTGPGGRAYVGPLFLPDAGPCAACLLVHFKRLSPVPELYDVVLAHDAPIATTPFPDSARDHVAAFAKWKLSLAANPMAAALYALNVIEVADLTVTAHAPLADVECTECRRG